MRIKNFFFPSIIFGIITSCTQKVNLDQQIPQTDSAIEESFIDTALKQKTKKDWTASDITLTKDLLYDKHTLDDEYPYQDTVRSFQFDKIKEQLAFIESFQEEASTFAVLQNHRNKNGEAPLVEQFHRNAYTRISDSLGVERYQSVPLYPIDKTETPVLYGRDGALVKVLIPSDTSDYIKVKGVSFEGTWQIPKRYVESLGDTVAFHKVAFVDVKNQNILTTERSSSGNWTIRSMNPATSGQHKPPYAQETPVGLFVIQQKKPKMYYYADGTTKIAGYAPYASRFTNGAYIHGVPTNDPKGAIIENSWSLGTVPRSHMCVRNASSHAKFIYDWTTTNQALVVVID